jgi:ElaB/YqjD/DUF883 family membrane-anchored ribosome-binding protein
MRRLTAAIVLILVAIGATACGDDARDAVQSATAEAGAALEEVRRGLTGELDRAKARVDQLVADARDGGAAAIDRARERADAALERARHEADEAVSEAEAAGDQTQAELDELRAEADARIDELRDRIDRELPDSP